MRRYLDFLTPIGLLIIVGAMAWQRAGKTVPGKMEYYVYAGLAFMLAHLVLRAPDIVRALKVQAPGKRQVQYGGNSVVFVLVILGILGAVNWLAFRHSKSWDLTKQKRHSLSDQTKKVVSGLTEDVTVTYFNRGDLDMAKDKLEPYRQLSSKFKYETSDPLVDPLKAREFGIRPPLPALVVQRGSRREEIHSDGEQDITNALLKITSDTQKKVCFSSGQGERDLDDMQNPEGYAVVKEGLTRAQYETQKIVLLRETIPTTCSVFVVAGPSKDLPASAIDAIRTYVKNGGRALILVEPELQSAYPNLVALLKEWNIEAGNDLVRDSGLLNMGNQIIDTGGLMPVVSQYPFHEITKEFRYATVFHTVRSMKAGTASVEGVVTQNLAETSPNAWGESDIKKPDAEKDDKDLAGPVPIGAVATIKKPEPESTPAPTGDAAKKEEEKKTEPEGRVVAFGDADFASNAVMSIGEGNLDFFLNTVAWLSNDGDLISIRPKDPENHRLVVNRGQNLLILGVTLGLLPGLSLLGGIVTWLMRRG